jgi:hypothetical protein
VEEFMPLLLLLLPITDITTPLLSLIKSLVLSQEVMLPLLMLLLLMMKLLTSVNALTNNEGKKTIVEKHDNDHRAQTFLERGRRMLLPLRMLLVKGRRQLLDHLQQDQQQLEAME